MRKKAETYYKAALKNNAKAKPYGQHLDLHYIYGDNVTVDWDKNPPARKVKDQAYWNDFFADFLAQYGPDMYKKDGRMALGMACRKNPHGAETTPFAKHAAGADEPPAPR